MRRVMEGMDVVATAPNLVSLMEKNAPFTEITMSQAHTKPTAAPMAVPCTKATVNWGSLDKKYKILANCIWLAVICFSVRLVSPIMYLESNPLLNSLPSDLMMTTLTEG